MTGDSLSKPGKMLGQSLFREILGHRVLIGIIAVYFVFALTLGHRVERSVDFFLYSKHFLGAIAAIVGWFIYRRFAKLLGQGSKGSLLQNLYTDVKSGVTLEQAVGGTFLFFLFSMYFAAFQSVKIMITAVKPFTYDVMFAEMDRAMHFGVYPHELLQPVLGYPAMTLIIQFFYNLWFPLMLGTLAWQMFDRRTPVLRMRFLVSFTLVWFVIGSVAAIYFSSAGPVYFDRVTGVEGPYEDHMAYLWSVYEVSPLFTLDLQDILWEHYEEASLKSGSGISAMPSVHVSMAMLLFLFARHVGKWARWGFGIFLAAIMLGSVHLAWHYAIDGYLGALLVLGIWWVVGRFYPASEEERATRAPAPEPARI